MILYDIIIYDIIPVHVMYMYQYTHGDDLSTLIQRRPVRPETFHGRLAVLRFHIAALRAVTSTDHRVSFLGVVPAFPRHDVRNHF